VDLSKVLSIGIGVLAAWVGILVLRFNKSQVKIAKLEQKESDDEVTQKVHVESDAKLDADLSKRLGR
jgi:hypothetical protein